MLNTILEWIYPPKCMICSKIISLDKPRWICEHCFEILVYIEKPVCIKCGRPMDTEERVCSACAKKKFYFERNYAVYEYDEIMRFLIHKFKYGEHPEFGKGLGMLVAKKYHSDFLKGIDCIVPVPMYRAKEKKRGFNQAVLLSKEISKQTGIPMIKNLLLRTKKTKAQSGLTPKERENNIRDAFAMNPKFSAEGKTFLVVDDIYTTGSTLQACARMLSEAGAKEVFGLTLSISMAKKV